jgi:kynurenine formamidase
VADQYIYLSYLLNDQTPLYGGGKGIHISPDRSIPAGDTANTKNLRFQNHSGTHIDFPNHFFDDGAVLQDYDANFWIFLKVHLLAQPAEQDELIELDNETLLKIPIDTDLLLLKTGFSEHRYKEIYWNNNPGIKPEVADQLRNRCPGLRAIGMDFISLTSFQNRETGREAHRQFLGKTPILLIEDMNLGEVFVDPTKVICLPLLIEGADGAPVTIIAEF